MGLLNFVLHFQRLLFLTSKTLINCSSYASDVKESAIHVFIEQFADNTYSHRTNFFGASDLHLYMCYCDNPEPRNPRIYKQLFGFKIQRTHPTFGVLKSARGDPNQQLQSNQIYSSMKDAQYTTPTIHVMFKTPPFEGAFFKTFPHFNTF